MAGYAVLRAASSLDACFVADEPAVEWWWKPTKGVPVGAQATPIQLDMSRRMGGKKVVDLVANSVRYLIVSEKVRGVLEAKGGARVEYIPATLVDHKRRPVKRPFFVANVLDLVDAVDLRRSTYQDNPLRPGELDVVRKLVLDPARIPPDRALFRLTSVPRAIVARDDLLAALSAAGVEGVATVPLDVELEMAL